MAKGQKKVGENKEEIIKEIPMACADEKAAVEFLEKQRWGDDPACPRCGDSNVKQMKDKDGNRNKRYLWRCYGCKQQFTVRIGTVFEDSRIPLKHWCYAFWRATTSKKGVSALEIQRQTGLSYKSALFLMHRIRFAMEPDPIDKLNNEVEVDETYVGGKPRFKGQSHAGRGTKKTPVVAMIQRDGEMKARVVTDVTSRTLKTHMQDFIHKEATVYTDQYRSYHGTDKIFKKHESVNHGIKEYARGPVHVNTCESFFAVLKRGITGVYHSVSKRHLHRYVSEFEFRFSRRKLEDGERLEALLKATEGKRLIYESN